MSITPITPQVEISYSAHPFFFKARPADNEFIHFQSFNDRISDGISFRSWLTAYGNVESQIQPSVNQIQDFINKQGNLNASVIQQNLPLIQINNSEVKKALKTLNIEMLRPEFNITKKSNDVCNDYIFPFKQNMMSSIVTVFLFKFALLLELEIKGTFANLSINNSTAYPSNTPNQLSNSTDLNQINTSFDHWPTAAKKFREQIDDLSKKIKAVNATSPYETLEEIWNFIQSIPLNGSDIANDLNTIEQSVHASKSIHSRDRGKLFRLTQNIQGIMQYLFSYQAACRFYSKAANKEFDTTTTSPEKLGTESQDQNGFKKGNIVSLFLTAVVSFTFTFLISIITQRRIQKKDGYPPLENDENGSRLISQLDIEEQKA